MHIEIKRVGVATDFSEPAERALHYGIGLAKQFTAELHLIHVRSRKSADTPARSP
jgi:nucleotide-binding universal stress UspA family protein